MRTVLLIIFTLIIIAITLHTVISNNVIRHTRYEYKSKRIPKSFDGFKIVQISDLHNKEYGKNGKYLEKKLIEAAPDIIVITGDLIHKETYAHALKAVQICVKLCPVYFVEGNHEFPLAVYPEFKKHLEKLGVKILDCAADKIEKNGEFITIAGIADPSFYKRLYKQVFYENEKTPYAQALEKLKETCGDGFNILLTHRPELIKLYAENEFDLVLAGHTHGGQVRLPFIGALYATGQSLFPLYASGVFEEKNTTEIISRGLGSSTTIPKIFNRQELVTITLKRADE